MPTFQERKSAALARMGQPIPQPKGAATADETAAGLAVREYKSSDDMVRGMADMARAGWTVKSQNTYQAAPSIGARLAWGIFARSKPRFVVTFTR